MNWSNELVLEFLDLYDKHSVIWDPSHSLYKNRYAVYEAWRQIKEELSVKYSIDELKKKKDSLMASYRTCCYKIKDHNKSGANSNECKPKWFAYERLARFLRKGNQLENADTSDVSIRYLQLCYSKYVLRATEPTSK